jgi:GntR family transcriptional regulator, phosphonate transport system regulatory protein
LIWTKFMLARKSGAALWLQIGRRIADDISGGTFAPGARLPTEPELAERFSVSRNTVRRAMASRAADPS